MFVPLSSSRNVMIGGAIPPLRKNQEDDVVLASEMQGSGSNQIVGVHNAAPKIKTLAHDKKSQDLVFHGGELLNKIKFGAKKNKRENIKFLF